MMDNTTSIFGMFAILGAGALVLLSLQSSADATSADQTSTDASGNTPDTLQSDSTSGDAGGDPNTAGSGPVLVVSPAPPATPTLIDLITGVPVVDPYAAIKAAGILSTVPSSWPANDVYDTIATAIAYAEGFNISGSIPSRYGNPGDLSKGDDYGFSIQGTDVLEDGENILIFSTANDGWNALRTKLIHIANGSSRVYSASMTWNAIAQKWAGNSSAWVANVTHHLGVDPNSTFGDYVGANS